MAESAFSKSIQAFCSKASTFFPRNHPSPNTQVGVVEHLWNLALWTEFPAIPATKLQILLVFHDKWMYLFLPQQIRLWSQNEKPKQLHQQMSEKRAKKKGEQIKFIHLGKMVQERIVSPSTSCVTLKTRNLQPSANKDKQTSCSKRTKQAVVQQKGLNLVSASH